MESLLEDAACVEPLAVVSRFRRDFHACLTVRADELSELADAVLCADGPVRDLAGLSLVLEHRRGHGALYDAVNYLPGDRDPKPVWLWWSRTGAAPADVDRCWRSFLRRFDLEPGSKNRHPAPRYDVGKTTKRELTLKARHERAG